MDFCVFYIQDGVSDGNEVVGGGGVGGGGVGDDGDDCLCAFCLLLLSVAFR